jgi:hypothetical protein
MSKKNRSTVQANIPPVNVVEVEWRARRLGMMAPSSLRRSEARKRVPRNVSKPRDVYRYFAVDAFAAEMERISGRAVTPLFYRLVFEAVCRGLRRPDLQQLERIGAELLPRVEEIERARFGDTLPPTPAAFSAAVKAANQWLDVGDAVEAALAIVGLAGQLPEGRRNYPAPAAPSRCSRNHGRARDVLKTAQRYYEVECSSAKAAGALNIALGYLVGGIGGCGECEGCGVVDLVAYKARRGQAEANHA